MRYKQGDLPVDPSGLTEFMRVELQKIERTFGTSQPFALLDTLHAFPSKIYEGQIILADGTDLNPGSGAGFYGYRGAAWRFLG